MWKDFHLVGIRNASITLRESCSNWVTVSAPRIHANAKFSLRRQLFSGIDVNEIA